MSTQVGNSRRGWRVAFYSALTLIVISIVVVAFRTSNQQQSPSRQLAESAFISKPVVVSHRPDDHDLFVGSHQCVSCHTEIAEAFAKHPMANSISQVTGLPEGSEKESSIVRGIQRQYGVVIQDGQMFHCDSMFDSEGEPIFHQSVRMDYIVGSGRRAFAFLAQDGNLMFQSPLNWYSRDRKWDLSPGYRPDDERRFRRRISDDCLSCHSGRVDVVEGSVNRYRQPAFLERSIGCEKCHGPGKPHIDFHKSDLQLAGQSDPIVNPSHLGVMARESVCNQCHLQAAARITRYGHSDFDFRPGQLFEDVWTAFDAGTDVSDDGGTRAVNHVQQMRDSRCYTASDKELGCISCHDPHRVPREEEKDVFYRQRCVKCHTTEACTETQSRRIERNDSCIVCHMPHREANNISHVTQTDHRILRRPEESAITTVKGSVQLRFFDNAHERMPEWEQNRAMGVAIWSYLSKKGKESPANLAGLLESSLKIHPDDGLVLSTLGALAMQHQKSDLAIGYLERAQGLYESEESAVAGLLELHYQKADWARTLEFADRCLNLDPGHPGYHAILADALMNSGRLADGIIAAEKSVELDPTRVAVRTWLANAYEKAGRLEDAAAMRKVVLRMQTAKLPR